MMDEQNVPGHDDPAQTIQALPLVVGVDLGGTQIRSAVLRGATLLSRVSLLTGEQPSPDRVVPRMIQAVEQSLSEAGVTLEQIAGLGIGAPGPLNGHTGVVFCPPNLPGWYDVPLVSLFQKHFNIPIFLENDANAAALGEQMFGAGRGSQEIVYITISTGIGGGVITSGKILRGLIGTAAELGHMTVDLHGPRCNCGNIGCLESITSGTAIAHRANERIALGQAENLLTFALTHQPPEPATDTPFDVAHASPMHVNARTVALAAEAGIPEARAIIAEAAEALGAGLVNIAHIFNPEIIILGGGVSQIGAPLLDPARRIFQERTMRVPRDAARIVMAKLGSDAGLVGAGALVYYHQ